MKTRSFSFIILILLFLIHFGLGFSSYYLSVKNQNTDYYFFYTKSLIDESIRFFDVFSNFGTQFFILFNSFFTKIGLNFLGLTFLYSFFSFIPYYYFYNMVNDVLKKSNDYFVLYSIFLLLFLPSPHFWLASFSKDSLCFLGIFIILNIVEHNPILKGWKLITVFSTLLLLFYLRPYLSAILVLSYLIMNYKRLNKQYLFIGMLTLGVSVILFITFFLHIKLLDTDYISIVSEKFNYLDNYSKQFGESYINLNETNVLQRFFYMMYRPIFFDAVKPTQFIISVENLFLFIWSIWLIYRSLKHKMKHKINIYIVFSILLWIFYSLYIYNYGLASRMKAIILPFLVYGVYECFCKIKLDEKIS